MLELQSIPHVGEQIFEELDNKSLRNSREVANSWQKFIDNKNLPFFVRFTGEKSSDIIIFYHFLKNVTSLSPI